VQDLTHLIPAGPVTGLAPTAQSSAGDMTTSNENAMTAPGTDPVTRMPDVAAHPAPEIESIETGRSVVTHGEERVRPVIKPGQWNYLP